MHTNSPPNLIVVDEHGTADLTVEDAYPRTDTKGFHEEPSSVVFFNHHPLCPSIAVEEEREAAHTTEAVEEEDEEEPPISSSWRHNVIILGHIFIHSILAGGIVAAIAVPINKVYLYDHYVNHANTTFAALSDAERVERYSALHVATDIAAYVVAYIPFHGVLLTMSSGGKRYLRYLRVWCVCFGVLFSIGIYYQLVYFPHLQIYAALIGFHLAVCFFVLCLAAKHNGGDSTCVLRIAWFGFCTIVGIGYTTAVAGIREFSTSSVFQWISPFVIPVAAFLVRYSGQRTELPTLFIVKSSSVITVMSSVLSRMSQCAYVTPEKIATTFIQLEVFYDVVGVIIRVTLYHRQLIVETIMSGTLWKGGKVNLQLVPQAPRNRLMSSQTVVYSIILDYASFIAVFSIRASLAPDMNVGTLIGVFYGL
eukprot:PhF_6_TR44257/c1_g1_i1/m.68119